MEFKVNIIGLGIMGMNVGRALMRDPRVRLTAAADLRKENLDLGRAELGFERSFTDYETMIASEKPDAVFIATPDWAHHAPVMACLDAGINVSVEKPLTTSEPEAADIVRKVRETGLKLQVSYNHRWLAPYHGAFDMIRGGKIGRCLMGYARKNDPITVPTVMIPWARSSSPMWFLSGHDIDLMTWWFDDDPVEVKGYGVKSVLKSRYGWDTYDAMQGIVKFSGGAFATFEAAWIYPESHPAMPDSFMEVIGEQGHIHLDRKTESIEMSGPEGFKWPRTLLNYKVFGRWVGAFPSCIGSFIDALEENREPYVTAYDGWRTTAVLDAIHRSADTGETVAISTPPRG
jgi:predicted dehydrogenase